MRKVFGEHAEEEHGSSNHGERLQRKRVYLIQIIVKHE